MMGVSIHAPNAAKDFVADFPPSHAIVYSHGGDQPPPLHTALGFGRKLLPFVRPRPTRLQQSLY